MPYDEREYLRLRNDVDYLIDIVWRGRGPGQPSIIMSLDRFTTQLETITKFIRLLWPICLMVIIIIMGLLVTNTFFGPMIRKDLGLPSAQIQHEQSERQNAIVPNLPIERKEP